MWILNRNLVLGLAAAACLCGCGSGGHSGAGAKSSAAISAAKHAGNSHDVLVTAVAANKSATLPVQVKFDLKGRPDVGQPVEVNLVIVPMSGSVERISGKVQGDDGLELVDGAEIPPSDRPAEGVPIEHVIKVRPQRDGIFTFSAVVTVDAGGQSGTETYSMPMIAGAGMPDAPKAADGASPGQRAPASPAQRATASPGQRPTASPGPRATASTGGPLTTLATAAAPTAPSAAPAAVGAATAAAH